MSLQDGRLNNRRQGGRKWMLRAARVAAALVISFLFDASIEARPREPIVGVNVLDESS